MKTFKAPNWDSDAEGAYCYQELFKKSSNKKSQSKLISANEKKQKRLRKIIKKQFSELKSNDVNVITVQTKIELGNGHKTRDNSSEANFRTLKEKKLRKKCKKSKAEVVTDSEDSDVSVTKNQKKLLKRYSSELNNLHNNSDKLSKELLKERRRQNKLKKKLERASNKQFLLDKSVETKLKNTGNFKMKKIKTEPIDESDKLNYFSNNQRIKTEQDKTGTVMNIPKSLELVKKIKLQEKLKTILNQVEKERKPIPTLTLRQKMMEKLRAARFRFLNEQIYTTDSKEAQKIFERDPEAFIAYHEGYRQQVRSWPMNPLEIIIKNIKKMPETHIVADFGCGDAKLARSVQQKVYSFDLVALNDMVVACDMSKVPLKDSSVDIAVFCLSLMGTNLRDYLIEANRVLKIGGVLKIAEVESRFESLDTFISGVQHFGFKKIRKDQSHNLFCFMDFKKVTNVKNKKKLPTISLLPCLYKKR